MRRATAARFVHFEALPPGVQLRVFQLLALDTRLRCVEVCRAWRRCLQDVEAWTHLVLPSPADTVFDPAKLLQAALRRASGIAVALDISATDLAAVELDTFARKGQLASLLELRLSLVSNVSLLSLERRATPSADTPGAERRAPCAPALR
jgi:hypothetical protein